MMSKTKVREYWERYVFNVSCYDPRQLHDVYGKASDAMQRGLGPVIKRMHR